MIKTKYIVPFCLILVVFLFGIIYFSTETGTHLSQNKLGSEDVGIVFQKPNTEWKSRYVTLNDGRTLYYVFGEGNPKEVAMDQSGLKKQSDVLCSSPHEFCNPEAETLRYMTPAIEKHLADALSDPNWTDLVTKCENNFRYMENLLKEQGTALQTFTFDAFIRTPLRMEDFLSVDPKTGWKRLDHFRVWNLTQFIEHGLEFWGRGEVEANPYGDCVDRYASKILRNLRITLLMYNYYPFTENDFSGSVGTTYGIEIKEYDIN